MSYSFVLSLNNFGLNLVLLCKSWRLTTSTQYNLSSLRPSAGIGISNAGSFGHPTSSSGGISTLSGTQFLWGSPTPYSHQMQNSPWSTPSIGHSFNAGSLPQQQGYSYSGRQGSYINSVVSSHHHHVGSAPSGDPSHLGYFTDSPDASFMNPRSTLR